jgi:hypothetical protein
MRISDNEVNDLREKLGSSSERKRKIDNTTDILEATKKVLEKAESSMKLLREEVIMLRVQLKGGSPSGTALGFSKEEFKSLSMMGSLRWVSEVLVSRMLKEIEPRKIFFSSLKLFNGSKDVGARTCALYNKGDVCSDGWHELKKKQRWDGKDPGKELRLHCCTLCLEALEIVVGHPVARCPWTRAATWERLDKMNQQTDD